MAWWGQTNDIHLAKKKAEEGRVLEIRDKGEGHKSGGRVRGSSTRSS